MLDKESKENFRSLHLGIPQCNRGIEGTIKVQGWRKSACIWLKKVRTPNRGRQNLKCTPVATGWSLNFMADLE